MTTQPATLSRMTIEHEHDQDILVRMPHRDELPSSDGAVMESARHRAQASVLIETLADHWDDRDDVYVGGNMFVYFSQLHAKAFRGPDVFVALETTKVPRDKWIAWEEGGKLPDVVIELLSPSTKDLDRGEKLRVYERVWKVGAYVLYDPRTHAIDALAMGPRGRFEPMPKNDDGDFVVEPLGLALGLRPGDVHEEPGPFLRWIDRGTVLPLGLERARAAEAGRDAERARADGERARAEDERARADEARARAEDEAARREAAERRIAELEAALAKGSE